ncbi:MAG: hypothetical protein JWN96_515 [Mycobacterium sp.]|nr:hypothetical protein [Mycobacterium sp.]
MSAVSPQELAIRRHCEYWNARDQAAWSALFAADVVFEDPVGSPPKVGPEAVRQSWERSLTPGREWRLIPTRIHSGGSEAVVVMRNEGNLHGESVVVDSLEVWRVNAAGAVVSVRAFFEPDPAVQSDYFQTERVDG